MKKIGTSMQIFLARLAGDEEQARINLRAHQVRDQYKKVMQTVYRQTAPLFLAHTNNVYIMNKKGLRTLIVYVDESIFSAELNAQRELIKLKMRELFDENIEKFEIYVSRGHYKKNHPYLADPTAVPPKKYVPVSLNASEQKLVKETASTIESNKVRASLEKAMTAAIALNKAEKGKSS